MPKRKATTLYIQPDLLKAAKLKAAITGQSVSDIANSALARRLAEDEEDLALIRERANQPSRPYEEVLRDLKRDGLL